MMVMNRPRDGKTKVRRSALSSGRNTLVFDGCHVTAIKSFNYVFLIYNYKRCVPHFTGLVPAILRSKKATELDMQK